MAFAHVQTSAGNFTADATPSRTLSAPPTPGNLLYAALSVEDASRSVAEANGFAKAAGTEQTADAGTDRAVILWKVAGAADAASAVVSPVALSGTSDGQLTVAEWSGPNQLNASNGAGSITLGTKTSPAVDPTDNMEALIVGLVTAESGGITWSAQAISGGGATTVRSSLVTAGITASQTCFDKVVASVPGATTYTAASGSSPGGIAGTAQIAVFISFLSRPPHLIRPQRPLVHTMRRHPRF